MRARANPPKTARSDSKTKTEAKKHKKKARGDSKTKTEAKKLIDCMKESAGKPWISLEYFPPSTDAGVTKLYDRIERMNALEPLFVDFTWAAGGSTADLTLELTANSKKR